MCIITSLSFEEQSAKNSRLLFIEQPSKKSSVVQQIDYSLFNNISVTELGRCQKPLWFRAKGVEPAPKHIYPLRGILLHSRIEKYIKELIEGEKPSTEWDIEGELRENDIPEHVISQLASDLKRMWSNFLQFMAGWTVRPEQVRLVEEKITIDLEGGFTLHGRPDLITDNAIIDFKSGKRPRYPRKEYIIQLLAYKKLYGDKKLKMKLIFLGGDRPEVMEISDGDIILLENAIAETIYQRKQMLEGKEPPAKFDFTCTMCDYRHVCRGV